MKTRGQLHIDQATYDRIGEVASIFGITRVQVVRDALQLLEDELDIGDDVTRRLADLGQLQDRLARA